MNRAAFRAYLIERYVESLGIAAEFVVDDAFAIIDGHPEWRAHPQLMRAQFLIALEKVTPPEVPLGKLWTGIMASVIVGLLIAAALAFKLPSAIAGPIRSLGEAVERMSKGDLDQVVTASGPKEFTTLTSALERMRVAQRTLMQRLRSRPA
jgi:methyl-accepting chemotaxis protein